MKQHHRVSRRHVAVFILYGKGKFFLPDHQLQTPVGVALEFRFPGQSPQLQSQGF
ncbi:MAG TPA: hypothetical protein PKV71_06835 [Calditrichia bacterium]|nr:hypothetical protein [Calditrichia bacterium]